MTVTASKEVIGRTGGLVKLGFSALHIGISVWVLTQQLSSITRSLSKRMWPRSFCFTLRRPRSRRPSLKNTRVSLLKMTSKCWFQSWKSSVFVSLLELNWFWMEKLQCIYAMADVKNLLHGSWNDHLFFERATFLYLILGKSIHLVKK